MGRARFALLLLAGLAGAAHAADAMEPGSETRWRCWYHGADIEKPVIACRLLQAGDGTGVDAQAATGARPLPPFVQRIRNDPRSLEDDIVVIPLHSPPIDMRLAARLARSVMCGRQQACVVDFGAEPEG